MSNRVYEAEVANHIHNPEVLVARGRFHDLFRGRHHNQGGVFDLGVDRNDVLGVVLHGAGRILRDRRDGCECPGNPSDDV
jgi:hypothetical protein